MSIFTLQTLLNPADHQLSSGETAGQSPIDGSFWNNINVQAGGSHGSGTIFPSTALQNNAGNANAATISTSANSAWFTGYAASSAANANELNLSGNHDDLFNSYLGLNSSEADISVTNISSLYTSSGYMVIVYSDSDRRGGSSSLRTSRFTLTPSGSGAIVRDVLDPGGTFNNTYVDAATAGNNYGNYTIFTGLTAASFTLDVDSPDGGRGAISGFQIIATSNPPPSISSFSANDLYVSSGDPVTLSWNVSNATSLSIDQGVGTVTGNNVSRQSHQHNHLHPHSDIRWRLYPTIRDRSEWVLPSTQHCRFSCR